MTSKSRAKIVFFAFATAAFFLVIALVTCLPKASNASRKPVHEQAAAQEPSVPEAEAARPETGKPETVVIPNEEPSAPPPSQTASTEPARVEGWPPRRPETRAGMAVIIDDAGYSLSDLQPFLDFPEPLTIAVLPNLPNSAEAARRVLSAGKGLLLHLPIEPLNGENPGPGVLRTDQSDAEIEKLLDEAFATVPGAQGLNNHMGSKGTADERLMTVVTRYLERRGLYMVDSRTTAETVAGPVAARLGVPFLQRDVFIDNQRDEADIRAAFKAGADAAAARGSAILIGHVHTPQILVILKKSLPSFESSGIRLESLQDILALQRESGK